MSEVTLDLIVSEQTKLNKLIEQFKDMVKRATVHVFPKFEITLRPGDRYAGPVLNESGDVMYHLVKLAECPAGKFTHKAAMEWAESVGGSLPTRQEASLLFANCKPHLKPEWTWTCEDHENDASYAWYCYFNDGDIYNCHKSYEGSAVAVSRIHING